MYIGRDPHLDDLVAAIFRDDAAFALALRDLVDELHAGDDLAPDGVLAVQPGGVGKADEELAIGAVGIARARHGYRAAHMVLVGELGLEILPRAAGAGARRIAGLRHEAGDHAMKNDAIVE